MSEEEEPEVTPEQTDLIVQYSAATGNEDLKACTTALMNHEWDLSSAISTSMAASESSSNSAAEAAVQANASNESFQLFGEGIRRRNPFDVPLPPSAHPLPPPIELPPSPQPNQSLVPVSFFARAFATLISFSKLIFASPLEFAQNSFSLFSNWWKNLGPELTPIEQVTQFGIEFNKQYDAKLPWLNCSYYSAVSSIRSSLRPIVVFLANKEKPTDSAVFAQTLLDAQAQMKDRIQFWGVDVGCSEGMKTAETLHAATYPSLLIVGLKNNQQHALYRTTRPSTSITQIITKIEMAEAELVTARHESEQRDFDRRLREEQDLEFQKTMELDRIRIEEENLKKIEEENKIKAAEERENQRQRRKTEHRERRISAKMTLSPEPKEGGICISLKLPNGSRHPRKFDPDASIQDVFLFVQSLDSSPGDYFLSTVFPTRKIDRNLNESISSLGIKNNEQLMVQEIQDDEFSDDSSDSSDEE
jgi:FAS-associated factor 2